MHSKPQYEVEHTLSTPRYGQYGYEFLLVLFSFVCYESSRGKPPPPLETALDVMDDIVDTHVKRLVIF